MHDIVLSLYAYRRLSVAFLDFMHGYLAEHLAGILGDSFWTHPDLPKMPVRRFFAFYEDQIFTPSPTPELLTTLLTFSLLN